MKSHKLVTPPVQAQYRSRDPFWLVEISPMGHISNGQWVTSHAQKVDSKYKSETPKASFQWSRCSVTLLYLRLRIFTERPGPTAHGRRFAERRHGKTYCVCRVVTKTPNQRESVCIGHVIQPQLPPRVQPRHDPEPRGLLDNCISLRRDFCYCRSNHLGKRRCCHPLWILMSGP